MAGLLRASEEGLKIIDMVRRNLGWNKSEDTWCKAALTSKATLRRFWAQNRIRRETFIDICKAVGINNWEDIIERNDIKQTELLLAAAIADIPLDNQTDRTFPLPENLPPVRNWVQRTKELDILKTLIVEPHLVGAVPPCPPLPPCPPWAGGVPIAISIVGLPGIGKTSLVSQLIRQLHTEKTPFTCAAWQSLQSATGKAPPFDRTIDSLLFTLSNGDITAAVNPQNDCGKKTENLLKILREKPCLLIFDRADTLLKTGDAKAAGYFAEDCAEYAWLFKQLLETEHQSKIIFTSRESLAELPSTVTREIQLNGLDRDAAVALLQSFNLTANAEELAEMCDRYSGHPKALQLVAALIRDDTEFQGNVGIFLHQRDWLLIRDIESANEMIARLGDGEQTCLSRISVYQTSEYPLSFAGISAQMPEVSKYELKENIIQALKRRQLLYYDRHLKSYHLHPLVREKGEYLLNQNPENLRTAHSQAYSYYISIPLKPKSEWQEIEDIKPLIRAHYHASQAQDLDAANAIISEVYEYLRQWNCAELVCANLPLPLLTEVKNITL